VYQCYDTQDKGDQGQQAIGDGGCFDANAGAEFLNAAWAKEQRGHLAPAEGALFAIVVAIGADQLPEHDKDHYDCRSKINPCHHRKDKPARTSPQPNPYKHHTIAEYDTGEGEGLESLLIDLYAFFYCALLMIFCQLSHPLHEFILFYHHLIKIKQRSPLPSLKGSLSLLRL
jgi:hypothetical protein